MADIDENRRALVAQLGDGQGRSSNADRKAAFDGTLRDDAVGALLRKVAGRASEIGDADMDAARSELSEDELFELTVCAAVGLANRKYEAALAALAKV